MVTLIWEALWVVTPGACPTRNKKSASSTGLIFASSAEMFVRLAKKIVVPQKGRENRHAFKGLLNTRQKTAGEEGWKVYTEITSEKSDTGKTRNTFPWWREGLGLQ